MILDDIRIGIAEEAGIKVEQKKSFIDRNISLVMEDLDEMGRWQCAIEPYTLTVPADKNKVSTSRYSIFRIVSCIATVSGEDKELHWVSMTDFKRLGTAYSTTNSNPTKYSRAGRNLFVGPGILASATEINGDYRRRLTLSDVEHFPGSVIIDGVLRRITEKGSNENISARYNWNLWKKTIERKAVKSTEEKRTTRVLDSQIAANQDYINNL
jgi:hypothetical protein